MFKFNDDAQPETDPNESLSSLWNLDEINSESTATFSDLLNADLFDTFGTGSSGTGDPLVNDGYESPSWILSQSLEILPEDLAVPADSSFGPFNLNSGETYHGLEDVELDEVKEEWFSEADFNSTMEWVNEEIERGKDIVASAAAGSSSEHEGSHAAPAYHFIKEEWFSDAEFNSTMEWVNEEIEKGRQLEGPEPAAAGASTEESQKVPAYHFVKAFLQPTTSQWSVQWIGERPNQFIRGEYIPCKNKESEVCNGIHCLLDEKGSCLVRSSACPYSSLNADESLCVGTWPFRTSNFANPFCSAPQVGMSTYTSVPFSAHSAAVDTNSSASRSPQTSNGIRELSTVIG